MKLALYTFGMFSRPSEDPANDDFHSLNDIVLAAVDKADGLIARSGYASDPGPKSWGDEVYPEFYHDNGDGWTPATLFLWADMESLFAFTYFDLHAAALSRGREWFQKPFWPPLVLWWHDDTHYLQWEDGVYRHKHLHENGPNPFAFTFKSPFDREGNATKLDKALLQQLRNTKQTGLRDRNLEDAIVK